MGEARTIRHNHNFRLHSGHNSVMQWPLFTSNGSPCIGARSLCAALECQSSSTWSLLAPGMTRGSSHSHSTCAQAHKQNNKDVWITNRDLKPVAPNANCAAFIATVFHFYSTYASPAAALGKVSAVVQILFLLVNAGMPQSIELFLLELQLLSLPWVK